MSKISLVAVEKLEKRTKKEFFDLVEKVMVNANWKKHIKGKKVFFKLNCLSDQLVPGQCTGPWVFEAVIKVVKKGLPKAKLYAGDADVATARQLETCSRIWGYRSICKRYGVKFVNLSKQQEVTVDVKGKIFTKIQLPKILTEVDSLVTLPVLKTHNVTAMTFSLKNQWGCLTRVRHQYHLVAGQCIAEINKFLKPVFAVGDATVCLEDSGPRVGIPKIVDTLLASADLVAIDTVGAKIIGLNYQKVPHIVNSEKIGVGSTNYKIVGSKPKNEGFMPAIIENHPIVKWEIRLRKVWGLKWLLFKTPLFKIPAFFAAKYNSIWWYNLKGKKYARELVQKDSLYCEEFLPLLQKINKI
ncbi:DUF362 domain-containing protein [Candidatus Woesearchaeota archaeon]|nr:DUF362 domain-containing protein [Candidatus Woesearchaeota archaeon]